jgi:hypothetical protein
MPDETALSPYFSNALFIAKIRRCGRLELFSEPSVEVLLVCCLVVSPLDITYHR